MGLDLIQNSPPKADQPLAEKFKIQNYLFLGNERDSFVENLSMLISSGMPIMTALDSIAQEISSRRLKRIISIIKSDIESGFPLWRALARSNLFPEYAVSIIRLGEESGRLFDNLKVVVTEQEKAREFRSKIHSAMIYPLFVLSFTMIIGIGIAWFILPRLALVFSQLKIKLPAITKALIKTGLFFNDYGQYVVPAIFIGMAALLFLIFSFSKTKFIGQFILFSTPGIKGLIKEVEVARFGYLLGTLLEAGLPITHALDSLSRATEIVQYRKFYTHLRDSVSDGNSLQQSFFTCCEPASNGKYTNRLIPIPIQQLIVAGEQSGSLSKILLKIGQTFEAKANTTTKNLTVIFEPILLVIVWLGVVTVALAVILPIYSLVGGFNDGSSQAVQPTPVATVVINQPTTVKKVAPAIAKTTTTTQSVPVTKNAISPLVPVKEIVLDTKVINKKSTTLRVLPTSVGYLNVRKRPVLAGELVVRVKPGDVFEYVEKRNGWYKIILLDGRSGWVIGKHVETTNN